MSVAERPSTRCSRSPSEARSSWRTPMDEVSASELLGLWRRMVRIRHFERRVSAIAEANQVEGYLHTYAGQEAVACGVIPLLRDDDWFTSTYRNHGHAIA